MVVGDGDRGKVGFVEVDAADFFDGCSVEVDDAFFDFQRIPWQGNDPLNPGLPAIRGVEEGDEVVVLGWNFSAGIGQDINDLNDPNLEVLVIPPDLLERIEDVLFNRRPDATERLVTFAESVKGSGKVKEENLEWPKPPTARPPTV